MVRGFGRRTSTACGSACGRPRHRDLNVDFLLEPFAKSELDAVESLVRGAADAVLSLVSEGLDAAREGYTRSGSKNPRIHQTCW